jgi:hypothetical protein
MQDWPSDFVVARSLAMSCKSVSEVRGRGKGGHLFHVLVRHYPRVHALELLEKLGVFFDKL